LPGQKEPILVQGVDSEGIALYDKAFSSDWHMPNAFRHYIAIPDDVIPEAWLNGPGFDPIEHEGEEEDFDYDDDDIFDEEYE